MSADNPSKNYTEIEISNLIPFPNHPFKLYEGERLADMVESVRFNGVIQPILVRPIGNEGKYEILSGHNRVEAAKKAELTTIPSIIREGLTDDEALLIVTVSNLIQRSFVDLKHSEKAVVLAAHYDAMKKNPGYRSDLLKEINESTGVPTAPKSSRTADKLGEQHGISADTIKRYLRVNKLKPKLKDKLDKDDIGLRVAVSLSYLRAKEQDIVEELLSGGAKINVKQANGLKEKSESANGTLSKYSIQSILNETLGQATKFLQIKSSKLFEYFKPEQNQEEIENELLKALEYYRKHHAENNGSVDDINDNE